MREGDLLRRVVKQRRVCEDREADERYTYVEERIIELCMRNMKEKLLRISELGLIFEYSQTN